MLAAILSMNYSCADFSDFWSLSESELSSFRSSEVDLGSSNFLCLILGAGDSAEAFFSGDFDSADKVMT